MWLLLYTACYPYETSLPLGNLLCKLGVYVRVHVHEHVHLHVHGHRCLCV